VFGVYGLNDIGGTFSPSVVTVPEDGTLKVMGFEGFNNTPLPTGTEITDLTFTAIPSSIGMDGQVSICEGTGKSESRDNSAVAFSEDYDDRLTEIVTSAGFEANVEPGDILVVKGSSDTTNIASTKTGTYLVRHVVETPAPGDTFAPFALQTPAGSGTGWTPFLFPTFVSYDTGTNRLAVSDLFSYTGLPELGGGTPSGFTALGGERVYIIRSVEDLDSSDLATYKESVISAEYSAIDEINPAFTLVDATWEYADGTNIASEADFEALLATGFQISGMLYFPTRLGGAASGLPVQSPLNIVGWDRVADSSVVGFRWFSLSPPPKITGTVGIDFDGAADINKAIGPVGEITVTPSTIPAGFNTAFLADPETTVYPNVPLHFYLGKVTQVQWDTLQNNGLAFAAAAPMCLLPNTELALATLAGVPGLYAQTGIFLEPSVPRSVFDLTPTGNAHLVDDDVDHSLTAGDIGMRDLEALVGASTPVPVVPEEVTFEVRRIRRFHDVLTSVGANLTPLRFAYEIRRGRITSYTHNVGGKQFGIIEADGFVMEFNTDFPTAPRAGDVWNTGQTHKGTNLTPFNDPNTNITVGDLFRVLDENGEVIDEVEVAGFVETGSGGISGTELRLAPPGLTALPPAAYTLNGGLRFEVYLRQPAVPHEQSNEQLLDLLTFEKVTQTNANYTTQTGGYVPQIQTGETYSQVANTLYDDENTDSFSQRGVRVGDIVIVDPAGTLPQSGGLPAIPEKGVRPFGDEGVEDRPADHTAATPNPLDDNRGFYRVLEVVDTPTPHLILSGESSFTGSQVLDEVFPENVADRGTFGYTVYPTVTDSKLNSALYVDTGSPDGREGQMDLRPTRLPDATTNSYGTYSNPGSDPGEDYSIRPFSYRIIRPSTLFSDNAADLILSTRERMLSLLELLGSSISGKKLGSYFIFQRDQHCHDLGSPTDPEVGLGVFSNLLIENIVGRMGVVPFANTSDALSLLDRRFWILDRSLDTLTAKDSISAKKAGIGDTPYTAYTEDPGGSSVRPVLPDRVDIVLNVEDRIRSFRFTWLAYRTHRILGTLASIQRFDDQLPERQKEEERLLQILASTETAE
jgi:hypothetical protein